LLLEQVGPVERAVGVLDLRELRGLAVGEILGVLPQRVAGALEVLGERHVLRLAGFVPDLAADLIQRVGRERNHMERVDAADRVWEPVSDRASDP
jgi:hypothetical protein